MQNIYKGLFFLFFNFSITVGGSAIGLIPDFYGYYLIWKGFQELSSEQEWFGNETEWIQVIGIYAGIRYGINILGIISDIGIVGIIMSWADRIGQLYVVYRIVLGVNVLEQKQYRDLQGKQLLDLWRAIVIVNIISYGLGTANTWLFGGGESIILVWILFIVGFFLKLAFLDTFSMTKDRFYREKIVF